MREMQDIQSEILPVRIQILYSIVDNVPDLLIGPHAALLAVAAPA